MGRPFRLELSWTVHHATSRGDARQDNVFDDRDCTQVLTLLTLVVDR